jgi:hypothetical protein
VLPVRPRHREVGVAAVNAWAEHAAVRAADHDVAGPERRHLPALAQLTAPPHVKHDIAIVARRMEACTLIMPAGLNTGAFTGGAFDAHWAQVAFGCFVPAAISGASYILARLTRR